MTVPHQHAPRDSVCRQAATEEETFSLLGTHVSVLGPEKFLLPYRLMFGRFAAAPSPTGEAIRFRIDSGDGGGLTVEQNRSTEHFRLGSADRVFGFVYARILDLATRRDPDVLCLHAAALVAGRHALAVAAPSHHGKSTLSLALAARGFTLVSDEVAAIDRDSLRLLPFPLAVGCRPGAARLLGELDLLPEGLLPLGHAGKFLLCPPSPEEDRGERAYLSTVVFVESPPAKRRERRRYRLTLEPAGADLTAEVAALDGVERVRLEPDGTMTIEPRSDTWVAPQLEALLRRRGVLVASVEDLDLPRPDFGAEPRLSRLTTTEGVLSMLRHLRGYATVEQWIRTTPGGFGALVLDIAGRMRNVRFHRLTPGRLPEMLDAIESIVTA